MMEKNPKIENSMINEHSKMRDNQIEMMNSNYNAMGIINEIGMNPMNMMNSFNNMMMSPITMVNSLQNQMIKPPPEALLYRMNFSMDNQNMINPNFINNELFK